MTENVTIASVPIPTVVQQATAEFLGTAFLVAAVVGSGITAETLSPGDVGLQPLENSIVTGAALVALILALQPVSASFNPVVTVVERVLGRVTTRDATALVLAQLAGGVTGAVVANVMFGLDAVSASTHHRASGPHLLGEVVATPGRRQAPAGSQPAGEVNPSAVEAMAEEGIDISIEQPKLLTESAVQEADVVITMGCGDECPYFPGKRYEDWVVDDPAGHGIDAVRPIRDEIRGRVEALIAELLATV